eukprot:TRINITY_DN14095_c0_g1_i14.p1 TRINITY_DN14095_c0_g1~~TRINITY_DN14095_c0_g1_i14.p1  ORF type:complete len:283 (-),score=61.53 TRINITY_DN14095_c0_g1_i14:231-1079(-)
MDWKEVKLNDERFLYKCHKKGENTSFIMHNTIVMYIEELTKEEFQKKATECNPDIEDLEEDDLIEELWNNFGRTTSNLEVEEKTEDCLKMKLSWDSDGIPLIWKFQFRRATADEFHEHLTSKLFNVIDVMLSGQQQLFKIIRDKDIELGEYKGVNVKITRPHLITKWFEPAKYFETFQVESSGKSGLDTISCDEMKTYMKAAESLKEDKSTSNGGAYSLATSSMVRQSKFKRKQKLQEERMALQKACLEKPVLSQATKRKITSEQSKRALKKAALTKKLQGL